MPDRMSLCLPHRIMQAADGGCWVEWLMGSRWVRVSGQTTLDACQAFVAARRFEVASMNWGA